MSSESPVETMDVGCIQTREDSGANTRRAVYLCLPDGQTSLGPDRYLKYLYGILVFAAVLH